MKLAARLLLGGLTSIVVACGNGRMKAGAMSQTDAGDPGDENQAAGDGGHMAGDGDGAAARVDAHVPDMPGDGDATSADAGADSGGVLDPGTDGDGDFRISPGYERDSNLDHHDGVPEGKVYTFYMDSSDSKFYDGHDPTLNDGNMHDFSRHVDVYIPSQYQDGKHAPFMVAHDGPGYTDDLKNALDNLINAQKLPAMIAIMLDNGGGDSIGSERGLEYDTMSDKYTQFIEAEVLPAVLANAEIAADHPQLALTKNPEGRGAIGCSSGGAAALTMGWFRPDLYHRIITYSGTFVDQQNPEAPTEQQYPDGAWEYHEHLIAAADKKPLRIFLQAGEWDLGNDQDEAGHHNWVMANQRTAAALKDKGYHYRFIFAEQANHCDYGVRQATLPETLVWMWRGYPLDYK
jgi:enterochelin esterase family protein